MVRRVLVGIFVLAVSVAAAPADAAANKTKHAPGQAVMWTDPGEIRSRDLFYGPGGKEGQPQAPFLFEGEDPYGNSPKFDVKDGRGDKWRAKMGAEARPETAATRLLWAVGYGANVDYFIDDLHVDALPQQLSRGNQFIGKAGDAFQVRLQRKPGKNHKTWDWRKNPLRGTREFNGLRVMMALFNNWDLKGENNSSYEDPDSHRQVYYVSDLGASFGTTGKSYSDASSRGNVDAYRKAKFVTKVTPTYVSFNFPTHPAIYHIFNLPYFIHQMRNRWIGRHIPREDVRWIASLLAQLTPEQIHDAFRAAGYTPQQVEDFSAVLQKRIAEISKL